MLIQVIRCDNRCDSIEESLLDGLIETHDIIKFKRGEEWVTVGTNPIGKRKHQKALEDNERRAAKDSSFAGQVRKASSSSLEPF